MRPMNLKLLSTGRQGAVPILKTICDENNLHASILLEVLIENLPSEAWIYVIELAKQRQAQIEGDEYLGMARQLKALDDIDKEPDYTLEMLERSLFKLIDGKIRSVFAHQV